MKRNLITILSLVVMSLMLNATGAYAQSYARANVPFAFNVGAKQLPAGTYEIKVLSQSPNLINIQNTETAEAAMSIVSSEDPRGTESKLVFDRVGTQYFLTEVCKGWGAGSMVVPTSKHEQELKRELQLAKGSAGGNEQAIIALK
ncbi:MAG: hypothetical protein WB711_06445 [Terriglobales bacterium]